MTITTMFLTLLLFISAGYWSSVYFLRLGVEFSLWIPVDITLRFPYWENSLSPLKLAVEVMDRATFLPPILEKHSRIGEKSQL